MLRGQELGHAGHTPARIHGWTQQVEKHILTPCVPASIVGACARIHAVRSPCAPSVCGLVVVCCARDGGFTRELTMLARAAVIWGIIGLVIALVIDTLTPSGTHIYLYAGFGLIAGGCSWALNHVRRVPQGLAVGIIVGIVAGLLGGALMAVAESPGTLHPARFIALKYGATMGLFALLGGLPWSLRY
jgi:hypothetical protein